MRQSATACSTRNFNLPRPKKTFSTAFIIVAFIVVAYAKTQKLTGKIVAYDLMKHNAKNTSAMQNQEVVVLDVPSQKQRYVKVMFSSFGTTQIEQGYFGGGTPLTIDVFRDKSCDEKLPTFVSQVRLEQMAGTYLLTDAFKSTPPGRIKILECYVAIQKKK
jgi:hypothetical protein